MSPKILLVGSHDRQLEDLLRECGVSFVNGGPGALEGLTQPGAALPGAIVFDVRGQAEVPAALAEVKRQHPSLGVVIVAKQLDPGVMLQSIRAGVNEFLTEPLNADDVRKALEKVAAPAVQNTRGKTFAFIGAKGGVGTTTIAVNVATALAQTPGTHVLLVDLHPAYGDAALFFGVEPRFSVLDAFENTHRLDKAYFKGLTVRTKSGVDLLASSDRALVVPMEAQRVHTLIDFTSQHYTHVVLDIPRSDSSVLDALEGVTAIVVVANQELSTVRGAARMTNALRQRYGKEQVQVVVSRFDADSPIGQADVERVIGGRIGHLIPSNYRMAVEALNQGRPIVTENHNKLSSSLTGFARSLAGVAPKSKEEPAKQAGLLGRLTGRR